MRPNIGITWFSTHQSGHSLWSNGTLQNILLLYFMLQQDPAIGQVWLINGGDADTLSPSLQLTEPDLQLVRFEEIADQLDVLIEGSAQIKPAQAELVHRRQGIVIAYRCGNDYIMDSERICFDLAPGPLLDGTRFDQVWTQPQHEKMCRSFWEVTLRSPVRIMPHIWSPRFIDRAINLLSLTDPDVQYGYQPGGTAKRLAIFEPNLNVVKTFLTPMLICETAYRQRPELFASLYLTNTSGLSGHPTFQQFTNAMTLKQQGVLSFEARYPITLFMARYADLVVSHQWENGLNYLYYDLLYGGYPLVHNSPFLQNVAYSYPDFDAEAGAAALLRALTQHDRQQAEYQQQADKLLKQVDCHHPANRQAHIGIIMQLLTDKRGGTDNQLKKL